MSIEDIKQIMDNFDPALLLPDLSGLEGQTQAICRFSIMIAPIILLALGLCYLLIAPKEANYSFGYRTWFGMGSVEAWRFTQKLAGAAWTVLGLILLLVMRGKAGHFPEMAVADLISTTVSCLFAQGIAALCSILAINLTIAILFDGKGKPRFKWNRK